MNRALRPFSKECVLCRIYVIFYWNYIYIFYIKKIMNVDLLLWMQFGFFYFRALDISNQKLLKRKLCIICCKLCLVLWYIHQSYKFFVSCRRVRSPHETPYLIFSRVICAKYWEVLPCHWLLCFASVRCELP